MLHRWPDPRLTVTTEPKDPLCHLELLERAAPSVTGDFNNDGRADGHRAPSATSARNRCRRGLHHASTPIACPRRAAGRHMITQDDLGSAGDAGCDLFGSSLAVNFNGDPYADSPSVAGREDHNAPFTLGPLRVSTVARGLSAERHRGFRAGLHGTAPTCPEAQWRGRRELHCRLLLTVNFNATTGRPGHRRPTRTSTMWITSATCANAGACTSLRRRGRPVPMVVAPGHVPPVS